MVMRSVLVWQMIKNRSVNCDSNGDNFTQLLTKIISDSFITVTMCYIDCYISK